MLPVDNLEQALFENLPLGIAIFDLDYRLQRCNDIWRKSIERHTPATDGNVEPGKRWGELIPNTEGLVHPIFERVLNGETVRMETLRMESEGTVSYWDAVFKPLNETGEIVGILNVITDVTERVRTHQALEHQVAFENIVTAISSQFINLRPEEVDEGINNALQTIGEFAGVDRSYVFTFSEDRQTMDNTHEWCAEGIEPAIEAMQNVPVEDLAWSNEILMQGEVLYIRGPEDLPPEAIGERELLEWQGIESLMAVPMVYRGETIGLLGFDAVRAQKTWSEESMRLLRIVGEIFVNALEHKRAQSMLMGQRQFLELLATGGTLPETLHALVRIIEDQWPGMMGLILLLDDEGRLHHGASANLPQPYVESLEGLEIGPQVGSCGTAAYTGERVIVSDIATDPRWDGLRDLALEHGLGACWSEPIFSSEGSVIGTFAMYYRHRRAPSKIELRTIETAAYLARVAIEHKQAQQALQQAHDELEARVERRTAELREANARLQQEIVQREQAEQALRRSEAKYRDLVENSNSIILQMDTEGNITFFNQFAQEFFGYTEEEILGRGVIGTIVPTEQQGDMDMEAMVRNVLREPEAYRTSENENVRRNGERVWVAWTNKALYDEGGHLSEILSIGVDRTEQKQAEEMLAQREREQAIAAERNRLARDLHDAVTQTLFSASLIAEVLPRLWERNPEEGHRRLDELRELTRGALAEMRTLLLELRPTALVEAELGDLLRQLAESITGRSRVPVELTVTGRCDLPAEVKVAFYRIAQEALNNVAKHAAAEEATVRMACQPNEARLCVRDDGRGFDLDAVPPDSLGLGIMRERAEGIDAALRVESKPGAGTQVEVVWTPNDPRVRDG